ncbi:hypothetical protein MMC30_003684 [Trapelia coarctata]|nr:hypothetical protein [Trapelia coarctata]
MGVLSQRMEDTRKLRPLRRLAVAMLAEFVPKDTSPSVYVVYYRLTAQADCYPSSVSLGSYSEVTIGYPPDAIKAAQTCGIAKGDQPINYTQLYYPEPNSIAAPGCSFAFGDPVDPAAYNIQGNPIFSQPTELLSYDTRWLPCSDLAVPGFGIYDPPYALTKVNPPPVTAAQPLPTMPPATPGGGSPAIPTPTGPVVLHSVPQDPSPVKFTLATTPLDKPVPTVIAGPAQGDPGASSKDNQPGDPKTVVAPGKSSGAGNPGAGPSPKGGQDPPVVAQPVTIGTQPVQQAPNGGVVVGTTTMAPGAQGMIGGTLIKVSSGFVVAGASTIAIPAAPAPPLPTVAGNPFVTAVGGGLVVGGNTITAGGVAATVGGTVISVLPSGGGVVVGGKTVALPIAPQPPLPTLAGQPIQTAPNGAVVVGGNTVIPGGAPITVGGTTFSVPVNGGGIIVNGNTMTVPPAPAASAPIVGGHQVQAGPNGAVVIGTNVIFAGGPAATISGTVISALPGGSSVIVNGNTLPLAGPSAATPPPVVAGQTVQTGPNGAVVIGGTTLSAGGPAATISGTVISVLPSGGGLVVGGSSTILLPGAMPTAVNVGSNIITFGAPAKTISGMLVSLGTSGLEIGSTFVPVTTGEVGNIGGIIFSAFGGSPGASPTGGRSNSTAVTTKSATKGGTSSSGLQIPTAGSTTTSGPASAKTSTTGDAGRTKDDVWLGMHALLLLGALWSLTMI